MEKKLELRHFAAYLPFGLKFRISEGKIFNLNANHIFNNHTGNYKGLDRGAKIILRPLSDLTKEIEVGGEMFVPIKEFMILYGGGLTEKGKPIWESDFVANIMYSYYGSLSYGVMEKLFEWHFDVFGLIEQELAIDINTLKQE